MQYYYTPQIIGWKEVRRKERKQMLGRSLKMWLCSVPKFHFGAVWKSRRHATPGRGAYAVLSCIFSLLSGKNYAWKLFFFVPLQPDFGSWAPLTGLRDHADLENAQSEGLLWTSGYLDNAKFSWWRLTEHKVQRSSPHGVHSPSIALACWHVYSHSCVV